MKELRYITADKKNLVRTEKDNSTATDGKGKPKAEAFRRYIPSSDNFSFINQYTKKFWDKDLQKKLADAIPQCKNFEYTNYNAQFVNYYEDGDYYKQHRDVSSYSVLITMYETPKSFKGGELNIGGKTIECKNNMMIFFPSHYEHSVNNIEMIKKKDGYGRYSIASFYYILPQSFSN